MSERYIARKHQLGEYITNDERLRRIGNLLLKGIYLWAEATDEQEPATREDMVKSENGVVLGGERATRSSSVGSSGSLGRPSVPGRRRA